MWPCFDESGENVERKSMDKKSEINAMVDERVQIPRDNRMPKRVIVESERESIDLRRKTIISIIFNI